MIQLEFFSEIQYELRQIDKIIDTIVIVGEENIIPKYLNRIVNQIPKRALDDNFFSELDNSKNMIVHKYYFISMKPDIKIGRYLDDRLGMVIDLEPDFNNHFSGVLGAVKDMNTPVLVHVYTRKGKGSTLAEKDAIKYYSLSGNKSSSNGSTAPDYSNVFGNTITQMAKKDEKIICVTAAMEIGTGITPFTEKYPERYIDVGIAEEHAITYSAGLAAGCFKVIVPIY